MENLLQYFIILPLIAFILSLFIPQINEKTLSSLAIATVGIHLLGTICLSIFWFLNSQQIIDIRVLDIYNSKEIDIFISFFYDKTTAVFSIVGSLLVFLVAIFSRYYMHRDEGFKRYFNTLLLFFLGYNIAVFSGNFETLFTGWEILGICSFLLISFYRDRYLPAKNALKVISLYRFGDICLILAMWMSHHFWHKNITFMNLLNENNVLEYIAIHDTEAFFIALMIVIAAVVKSAQMPFSSWLPRAMEGPTTSSAIFYGSLSVHLGVFLLIRTYPFWESLFWIKAIIIAIGAATCLISNNIAHVQSTVKTQIAYASITQIGFMFIEVALGFHTFALIHFAGNAFLRTYQLLVSPSVLSYLIHDQFFSYTPPQYQNDNSFLSKLKKTVYVLSIKEWNLDAVQYYFLWKPFKWIGKKLDFLTHKISVIILIGLYLVGLYCDIFRENTPLHLFEIAPFLFSFIGLILILKAFAERGSAIYALREIVAAKLFISLSIALLNEEFDFSHIIIYLSGSLICALLAYVCLKKLKSLDNNINLDQFHGYSYEQPVVSFGLLVACLGLVGLPFTPTFIGMDILFSHIHKHEELIIFFTVMSFLFIEIAILRMYTRICMGQHKKANHPIAFRSS